MGFCFAVSFYFSCNNKVSICNSVNYRYRVVVATAKVQIFKQITTDHQHILYCRWLLLLPQRYKFSSKSQRFAMFPKAVARCCCYRKGTNFQANHNARKRMRTHHGVVVATAKVQIFKQITTDKDFFALEDGCCCYRKGTNFQANHNGSRAVKVGAIVVVATAKVQIFKQITTFGDVLPQLDRCCCYRKGTNFQANHNYSIEI